MKLQKRIVCLFLLTSILLSTLFIGTQAVDNDLGIPFDPSLYYGRSVLSTMANSENLIKAYDALVKGIQNGQEDILLSPNGIYISDNDADFILAIYRFDNPQVFWIDKYQYYYGDGTGYSHGFHIVYNSKLNTEEAKKRFNDALNEILSKSNINTSMSEYQISKILHDNIIEHVTYQSGENEHNIYGALVEKKCVCEGYAELYQYLLYLNGISAHVVTGKSKGIPHAWNLVRIDGKYYLTDVTWDDGGTNTHYSYFNVTTAIMSADHVFDDNGYPLPNCTATDAFYYNKIDEHGDTFTNTPNADTIVNQIKKYGYAKLFYSGSGTYTSNNFGQWINNNLSLIIQKLGYYGTTKVNYVTMGREILVYVYLTGDTDGNGEVTGNDAINLLNYLNNPQGNYRINQECDFNKDSKIDKNDAIYLLYHTIFGQERYPI